MTSLLTADTPKSTKARDGAVMNTKKNGLDWKQVAGICSLFLMPALIWGAWMTQKAFQIENHMKHVAEIKRDITALQGDGRLNQEQHTEILISLARIETLQAESTAAGGM